MPGLPHGVYGMGSSGRHQHQHIGIRPLAINEWEALFRQQILRCNPPVGDLIRRACLPVKGDQVWIIAHHDHR